MRKIIVQLIVLSVLFAVLFEDAEAIGFFGKKKALGLAKAALVAKKAKLVLPKLKRVGKKLALKKVVAKKLPLLAGGRKKVVGGAVIVPVQRPNSYELNHYVESAPIARWNTYYQQPQWYQSAPILAVAVKKPLFKPIAIKKKGGLKKLALLKKLLG